MAQAHGQQVHARKGGISELARAEERTALWLLFPSFLIIALLALYPLGRVFYSSFTNERFATVGAVTEFVGVDNYRRLLSVTVRELAPVIDPATGQQEIRNGVPRYESWVGVLPRTPLRYSALNEFGFGGRRYVIGATNVDFIRATIDTLTFTLVAVVLETLFGMIIALTLSAKFRGRGIMRAAMLVPWAIITVVSARIWEWMLRPNRTGLFNALLDRFGMEEPIGWLTTASYQLPSAIAIDVWKTTPFMALLIMAGLATIPSDVYEAAEIDGASKVRQFFSITLPLVMPTLAVALIFRTLDTLRVFDLFQVVFAQRRYSMASFAQSMLIDNRDVGLSSAASVIIFILIFGFAIAYIRLLNVDTD